MRDEKEQKSGGLDLDEQQVFCADAIKISRELFNDILLRCGLNKKEDPVLWHFLRRMLIKQTNQRIISSIWAAFTKKHADHFRNFMDSMVKTDPDADHETALTQFAILYPDICEKVFDSLREFFDNFIQNYRKIFK